MSGRLPQTVNPGRLAEAGETLRGSLRLDTMPRLADSLHDTEGEVDVELQFGVAAPRLRHIKGHLATTLHVVCQRCLQPMTLPVTVDISLGLVASEAAAEKLGEMWDPLIVGEDGLELRQLVEDELLLALPIVPMHAAGECDYDREVIVEAPPAERGEAGQETRRPFEHLSALLRDKKAD